MNKSLNDRIKQMFDNRNFDDVFLEQAVEKQDDSILYDYQQIHMINLLTSLEKSNICLDASNTGTGKTYTTCAIIKKLKMNAIIICPKSILSIWKQTCNSFEIKPLLIINYDAIKSGIPTYLDYSEEKKGDELIEKYKWNIPNNTIIIFDEAHKCKNRHSLNGKILLALKNQINIKKNIKCMLLSATICDKIEHFMNYGYLFGFYDNVKTGKSWLESFMEADKNNTKKKSSIFEFLFPKYGSRMTLDDIGEKMPKNQICVDCYDIDDSNIKKINKLYKQLQKMYENELVAINKARQEIEYCKIPIIIELINKYLEMNKSIVVFVNYLDTLRELQKNIRENISDKISLIEGNQTSEERDKNINLFQKNKNNIILCMMQAGGQSISLHDTTGDKPRVSIISPSYSSIDLIQCLGRIYRTGLKTVAIQKIVYISNTQEEDIANKIKKKIKFLNKINDSDLKI